MRTVKRDVFFLISFFFLVCAVFVLAFPVNALDAVYDNYTDLSKVEIVNNVVRNTTFNTMELNFSLIIPYENFTTYTEVDGGGDLTVNQFNITWTTMTRGSDDYVYKDFGIDYFDDFTHDFTVSVSDMESGDASVATIAGLWTITNTIGTQDEWEHGDAIALMLVENGAVDDQYTYFLLQYDGGILTGILEFSAVYTLSTHYITVIKNGTRVDAYIYSDAERLNLLESIGDNGVDGSYRYFEPIASPGKTDSDALDHSTGYVEDYILGDSGFGYANSGFFYTTEMISSIGGKTIVLLTNATVPIGDTLTVEFSEDNITWGDHEGNPGGDRVIPGFESIDLRDLSYSDLYMRYNFTNGGASTPRLYQIIVITNAKVAGNASIMNVTGAWIEYNFTSIRTLIGTNASTGGNWLNQTYWLDEYQFNVTEVVGAPGYNIQFEVSGLPDNLICLQLVGFMAYDGSMGHIFEVQAWNYTSSAWITISDIPDTSERWINGSIACTSGDFIQNGLFQGRYYHPSPGNVNHDFVLDFGKLRAFAPFPGPAPVGEDRFIIGLVIGIALLIIAYVYYEHGR